MKILVSACLAGENCKYNGGNNRNGKVLELFHGNEVITICPEVYVWTINAEKRKKSSI